MWLISLGAVILCSFFLARMTANLVALQYWDYVGEVKSGPVDQKVVSRKEVLGFEAYAPIVERNVFDSNMAANQVVEPEAPETSPASETPTGEALETALKIKLVSTFSVGEGTDSRSTCIISGGDGGKGNVFTVGDEGEASFNSDTKIIKILFDRVEFVNRSRLEYVLLEDFSKGVVLNVPPSDLPPGTIKTTRGEVAPRIEKTEENRYVIERAEIDNALANLDKLYTQVRAVPHFKDGKPNGLKLLSVRAGSLFSTLGLARGDILQRINGVELDIRRGLEIFSQLKTETQLTMDIERGGKVVTQEYEIR